MDKILLVESDRVLRRILKEALQAEKWEVVATSSREIGLQLASECIPDAIVCDAIFPVELGKFLECLHQNPITSNIPTVVLATPTAMERTHFSISNQTTYWVKPLNIPILLETISSFCSKKSHAQATPESFFDNFQSPTMECNIA